MRYLDLFEGRDAPLYHLMHKYITTIKFLNNKENILKFGSDILYKLYWNLSTIGAFKYTKKYSIPLLWLDNSPLVDERKDLLNDPVVRDWLELDEHIHFG